jgi:hypothetical protein
MRHSWLHPQTNPIPVKGAADGTSRPGGDETETDMKKIALRLKLERRIPAVL